MTRYSQSAMSIRDADMSKVTLHDIEANGVKYILEWTHADEYESNGHMSITEACDHTPCDWFENNATVPSWCCATHQYDGTGDYPTNQGITLPEVCPFSPVDEDGECRVELETYDFKEYEG